VSALTRAAVAAMPPAEYRERRDEVRRWVSVGAPEGEPAPAAPVPAAPVLERPEGHTFTLDEIAGMSQGELMANRSAIHAQAAAGGLQRPRRNRMSS
jgi:hypothetical protein